MNRIMFVVTFVTLFATALAGTDCQGRWSSWLPCDGATCGGQSKQQRFYEIQVPKTGGGADCPFANNHAEERDCIVLCSDQNCEGNWGAPGPCVADGCGSSKGKATRTYVHTKPQGPGGEPCAIPAGQTQEIICSATKVPCKPCVGHFVDGPCESEGRCDHPDGKRKRTYKITDPGEPGGAPCPHPNNHVVEEPCAAPVVPCQHCEGKWEKVGTCVSNGVCNSPAGKQKRVYKITKQAGPDGRQCPHKDGDTDEQPCQCPEITPCIDCKGTWSEYSECKGSGQCGSDAGTRTRKFTVTQEAGPGGKACPATNGFVETSACACPVVPCKGCEGSWGPWGECLSEGICSSSAGKQSRVYQITDPGEEGGAKCPFNHNQKQTRDCVCPTVIPCPPEACVGSFGDFTQCKVNGCGTSEGTRQRTFKITKAAKHGGAECAHPNGFVETVECECPANEVVPCPVDCKGHFEEPSPCVSAGKCSSDEGYFTEKFVIDVEAKHGGKHCRYRDGYIKKTRCAAQVTPCPPEDCIGSWKTTECRANQCGSADGESVSTFSITKQARYGGKECEAKHGEKRKNVCKCPTVTPCPVDCEGAWTDPTPCASIGKCSDPSGTTERTYVIKVKAAHGGKACPHADGLVDKDACNTAPVTPCPPIPCVGQWHSDKCVNTKCGTTNGNQTQVFKVTQRAKYDGKSCEAEHNDKRVVQCESEHIPCPVDCVGKPSEWSKCKPNHKCGSTKGERSRTFEVSVAAAHGGVPCVREDKAVETEDCEVPLVPCPPEPCIGGYSPPSACKQKECDNAIGVQTSVYRIEKRARYNGTECPAAHGDVKEEECTIPAEEVKRCPIDCKGAWTEFSKCVPTDCGCPAGKQQRQFHVEVEAQFGGKKCAAKHLSVHERDCQADEKDIKRCPNALLDAPCEDLTEIVGEAKALRCKVSAILEALQKHEKK